MLKKLILISLAGLLLSCAGNQNHDEISEDGEQSVNIQVLEKTPAVLNVKGHRLSVETYLWRDFQPVSSPEGHPLRAVVRLKDEDDKPIDDEFILEEVFVWKDDEIWNETLEREGGGGRGNMLSGVARNGPLWNPDQPVDVVLKFKDKDGEVFFIKAENQKIERTY